MIDEVGYFLILAGIALVFLGIIFSLGGKIPYLGRLPLDFKIEQSNFRFYFPLGSSILISLVLTIVFWLLNRLR